MLRNALQLGRSQTCTTAVALRGLSTKTKSPKIKALRGLVMPDDQFGADCHKQQRGHWIIDNPIAHPMSGYEKYRASRVSWGIDALGTVIAEVELEDGTKGVGASIGGEPSCFIIEKHLSRFVEGQDIRRIELMYDQMWRSTINYGRKGLAIQTISAVDLALWDALGKYYNEPIYNLIGGKVKDHMPIYATTSRPDLAKKMGFVAAKFPLPYGPAEGEVGLAKNVAEVKKWREAVGPDFPLSIDCYMSLTVPYTIKLAHAIRPYNIRWLEEFLPPDDYDGYEEVKKAVGDFTTLTTGEHEYTRYGFRELIKRKCVDILQPDITWCGGLTEARKIVNMAAAYDIPIIPHGSSVFSYHLQYANVNCPLAEMIMMAPQADKIIPAYGTLFEDEPLPKDGVIDITDKPGWGVTLNRAHKLRRPYNRNN